MSTIIVATAEQTTDEKACPGWCPGPEQHYRGEEPNSVDIHQLWLGVEGTDTGISIEQDDFDPGALPGAHVALPNGDEITADDALELGRALIEAYDTIRNDGPTACSPIAVELTRKCSPLASASVLLSGWLENFAELNHAIRSAVNSGAIPTHVHEGRLHVLERDVIGWHVSRP